MSRKELLVGVVASIICRHLVTSHTEAHILLHTSLCLTQSCRVGTVPQPSSPNYEFPDSSAHDSPSPTGSVAPYLPFKAVGSTTARAVTPQQRVGRQI
ncbi:hypothetical protein P171DRAFT_428016 [Karstenula rhodostoma CBS 690.94]|uniref:Uncharacterized protein n=1 Tax=Karstenula rhodostoma CBS 690.94 TaxID=1392251 RepID=A0A9P4UI35_9PLEO|nr:hypothetical protein P171DRAFT_428016 [Karstenula rhodostoma CBS 690.94]